jgi:hypothetical protein
VHTPAVPGGVIAAGAPLPDQTAMVTRVISFERGDALPTVTLTCPEGTRIAGMLPPAGARIGVGYAPGTTPGVGSVAELVFERRSAGADGSIVVGTLCRAVDRRGSVIPGGDPADGPWTQACAEHTYLLAERGGEAVGSVRSQQPLRVDAISRGWAEVETDTGERGWLEVGALCPEALIERP